MCSSAIHSDMAAGGAQFLDLSQDEDDPFEHGFGLDNEGVQDLRVY